MDELTVQKRPNGYRLTARGCDSSTVINLDHSATEALVKLLVQHWTGGPTPADGMVLVDAKTLRRLHQAEERVADIAAWVGQDQGETNEQIGGYLREKLSDFDLMQEERDQAREAEASIRERWSELGDIYNAERERRQLAQKAKRDADLEITRMRALLAVREQEIRKLDAELEDRRLEMARMRAAAAMAPECLDDVHVAVSPEAVDEVLEWRAGTVGDDGERYMAETMAACWPDPAARPVLSCASEVSADDVSSAVERLRAAGIVATFEWVRTCMERGWWTGLYPEMAAHSASQGGPPDGYRHGYVAGMWAAVEAGPSETSAYVERCKAQGWTRDEPGGGVIAPGGQRAWLDRTASPPHGEPTTERTGVMTMSAVNEQGGGPGAMTSRDMCKICHRPLPTDEEQRLMEQHRGECSDDECDGPHSLLHICWPWRCNPTCATVGGETGSAGIDEEEEDVRAALLGLTGAMLSVPCDQPTTLCYAPPPPHTEAP